MPDQPSLAVVIPVFNEQENLAPLLNDWLPVFRQATAHYRIILVDDGSTDQSLPVLREMQRHEPSIEVITQANAGHGPAILRGYRMAVRLPGPGPANSDAEWVFQIDSDHQLDPAAFRELWDNRDRYDLLLAERVDKNASAGRRLISGISRCIVHGLYGPIVDDVNSPYRLMRSARLSEALLKIPARSFAPNILITAWFVRRKRRIFTMAVTPRGAAGLRRSKLSGHIWRGAIRSAVQTVLFRLRC
ncbi:MAG TPA: glycosyltransferase family 2 protein [Puia sp.]|jgi:glycosyltransferase involved in cell wall biosynthesis|nr:glycosyltransferase family 2 protein [Puia sp.]